MTIDLEPLLAGKCRRCGKFFNGDRDVVFCKQPPKGPRKTWFGDGDVVFVFSVYHRRCLPPKLFHQLAGSLPVGQSGSHDVPSQEARS